MNDKDKEAFNEWRNSTSTRLDIHDAWQAACEYKQKEVDKLKSITSWTVEQDGKVTRHLSICDIEKLQAENKKLREALEFYAEPWERGEWEGDLLVRKIGSYDQFIEVHSIAREALKEIPIE